MLTPTLGIVAREWCVRSSLARTDIGDARGASIRVQISEWAVEKVGKHELKYAKFDRTPGQ